MGRGSIARIGEIVEVPRDLLLGRYPSFVTGGPLAKDEVPVFVFHSLEPVRFGTQLDHLARNGYVTLSVTEYFAHLTQRSAAPPNSVLLTFDDARGSLWSVGAPLLRRHGMRGTVFIVPGRVTHRAGCSWPAMDDPGLSDRPENVLDRESGEGAFLFWEEIVSLAREGVFDFGSHTLSHSRVHCGSQVDGFVTPDCRLGYRSFDLPMQRDGDRDLLGEDIPLGAPVLRSAPRLSERVRVHENPDARMACAEAVSSEGMAFFARPGWQRRLRAIAARFPPVVGQETETERRSALHAELAEAQRLIEAQVGSPVTHLCYPWHSASPLAREIANRTGHVTAFCGKIDGRTIARPGDDPMAIPRIGEDWLMTLPGKGRMNPLAILRLKWSRGLRSQP